MAFCSGPKAPKHQRDGDHKAADASADGGLEAAAANKHKQSDKQPAAVHDHTQQLQAATDRPSFDMSKASKAEATQALASVGLTDDLIQALLKNFTTDQLQACLDNAKQMENITGAAAATSETQLGVLQAGSNTSAPAAVLSSTRHHAGTLPGSASQMPAKAAAQAAGDKRGSRLLLKLIDAADTNEGRDAAPQVGVLLVSGSHLRHWLAATNMVGPPPAPPPPFYPSRVRKS